MEKNTNKKPVQLPKGHMCGDCCGDCIFLDKNQKHDNGTYTCGKTGHYMSGGHYACVYFQRA